MPTPPRWFVAKLKNINRNFDVWFDPNTKLWVIGERVRWSVHKASREGSSVYEMTRRPLPALRVSSLGSKVLDFVRRNDPRKYKNVQEMIDALDIDDKHGYRHPTKQTA